jgi:hypothetical protein
MRRPFERSEITKALVRYLAPHDKGARVTYRELSEIAGMVVDARTSFLTSARRVLEREHAQVWVCIAPNVCIVRLNDPEIVDRQRNWYLFGARNKLAASARQADVVELERLNIQQQARFATDSIIREIARDALARTTARRIEKVARGSSNDLPAFNAVDWMISLSPKRAPK